MLNFVVKLTKDATKVRKDDHERLRAAGFDDKAILQITLIASWFNYINRVADALGVGREQPLGRVELPIVACLLAFSRSAIHCHTRRPLVSRERRASA